MFMESLRVATASLVGLVMVIAMVKIGADSLDRCLVTGGSFDYCVSSK
jgi:hypothetical protein